MAQRLTSVHDFGKELIIDMHNCNPKLFTRRHIRNYFKEVCDITDMVRCKLSWWDDLYTPEEEKETEPHLVGTTAIQFIKTSNITIHTLTLLQRTYLNIFSCKDFNADEVLKFSKKWFDGVVINSTVLRRM